jgi:hypothetical protein
MCMLCVFVVYFRKMVLLYDRIGLLPRPNRAMLLPQECFGSFHHSCCGLGGVHCCITSSHLTAACGLVNLDCGLASASAKSFESSLVSTEPFCDGVNVISRLLAACTGDICPGVK